MIGFSFLFGLVMVVLCEGKVNLPPGGNTLIFVLNKTAIIRWSYTSDVTDIELRSWYFKRPNQKEERIASMYRNQNPDITKSSLPGIKVEKPATLILKSVDERYNGTYRFQLSANNGGESEVTVIIAVKPKVTVSCSSTNPVIEGDNFECLCKGEGGNPAPADVTWFDNNAQPIGTGKGEKLLTVNKVTKAKSGNYKCEAKTHEQAKSETSIELIVKYIRSFTSIPVRPAVGKTVTITCVVSAHSKPTYAIIRHGSIVSAGKPHTIFKVSKDDAGTYTCNATNAFGYDLQSYTLIVGHSPSIFPTTRQGNETADDDSKNKNGISVGAIVGIVIGVLVLLLLVGGILWWFKGKSDRKDRGHERVGDSSLERKPRNTSNQPHEYATLEKPEPITYAALDKKDLKKGGPEKPARTQTPTEYADIQVA